MVGDNRRRTGTVIEFDAEAGLGQVAAADGASWLFHCTAIADGSRAIAVDTPVTFTVAAGGPGRWEAFSLRPTAAEPTS
ncbi:MAG: hypothetical protein AAF531_17485 [Actinomycetota bacterium]